MNNKLIVFFLMGPTAIGKSALASKIKKKFSKIELLSVDSKLIYKGLDIGTDKPTKKELAEITYRLLNIKNPQEIYSVADFYHDARKEIKNIFSLGKIPFFVGGSMLYFKVLLEGLVNLPPSNPNIREYIFQDIFDNNKKKLFNALKRVDNISSNKIHINDVQRVLRAMEIFFVSGGIPLSKLLTLGKKKLPYTIFQFGLIPKKKKILYKNIQIRFQNMLNNGFEQEVRNLCKKFNFHIFSPSMNSIGYKQMWNYLQKKCTYQEMICNTLKSTYKLVKHQLTWMRNWKDIILIKDNKKNLLIKNIENIIKNY